MMQLILITGSLTASAQNQIKINQIGFYPDAPKVAVIPGSVPGEFSIVDAVTREVVYTGRTGEPQRWEHSGEMVMLADFSDFAVAGRYYVQYPTGGISYNFEIKNQINRDLSKAVIRALYYNRASAELKRIHAGQWARPAGHPDTIVYVHRSAATEERPEGYVISSPKGWYDAGDYNKYIVNSGISTFTILAAYEHFPEYYADLYLNIPESSSRIPDILDEARWNLDWMLTMQDPNDGGVYHKLTHLNFQGIVMPHEVSADRYVVKKSTAATLNFAAVMAVASRVYKSFDPDFAAECLQAAEYAWTWAVDNPAVYYVQPPDVYTGEYGDNDVRDEFDWAAAELYITTGNEEYWHALNMDQMGKSLPGEGIPEGIPDWRSVRPLAWVSLAHHRDRLSDIADSDFFEKPVMEQSDYLRNEYRTSAYRVSMGLYGNRDFIWGSNSVAANQSLILLQAYKLTGDESYLDAAHANLDYLLGRNPAGYSFVTGYGSHPPMNPHHRPSAADGYNIEPVPGFLAGGPNARPRDNCEWYPSAYPALSFRDDWCSYSTNEVAINWNAGMIYLTGAIEYYRNK